MFDRFRIRYPQGSLVTELSAIDHGKYIVRCLVQVEGITLATGLAAAESLELAEDRARSRALEILGFDAMTTAEENKTPTVPSNESLNSTAPVPSTFSSPSLEEPPIHQFSETAGTNNDLHFSSFEPDSETLENFAPTEPAVADEISYTNNFSSPEVEISREEVAETSDWMPQKTQKNQKKSKSRANDVSEVTDVLPLPEPEPEPELDTNLTPAFSTPVDFSEIIARTNVELKRLGWTNQQGREYLLQTYGKKSRQLLTDAELLDFLHHLERL